MTQYTVLLVDDEQTQARAFAHFISKQLGYKTITMGNGLEVVDFFLNKKEVGGITAANVDIMLLDISMPDLDGIAVLKQINVVKGDTQVIVLTAKKDSKYSVAAINSGAADYVMKGGKDVFLRITASINNAIDRKNLQYQISHLVRKGKDQVLFSDLAWKSVVFTKTIAAAKQIFNSTIPILLEGPSGSGKELLARAIHGSGLRSGKPFVVFECDLIKSSEVEERLFGSDAIQDGFIKSQGSLREANGGTIFFREIDGLKPPMQAKLLSFLQDGEFVPVEGKQPSHVDVRMIFSTTETLENLVKAKKFREDLYFRISAFPIIIPGLRLRGEEDIKLLAEKFLCDFAVNENKKIKSISPEAMNLLNNYGWDGNVRQLKNAIFRAVVLCDGDRLDIEHFPQLLSKEQSSVTKAKAFIKKNSDINSELIDIFNQEGKCRTLDDIEEEVIKRLVDIYQGNLSEVAKQLGIGRSTIYRKLKISEGQS